MGNADHMRLRQIEILNALMITGTVTAAARALHVTQPAITHALLSMEREIGYPLFERVAGRLKPTPEGRILGKESEALMRQFSSFSDLARRMQPAAEAPVLRMVAAPILCATLLPRAIAEFSGTGSSPISLESKLSAVALEEVESERAELAVVFARAQRPTLLDLPVGELPAMCLAPKGAFKKGAVRVADLSGHNVLVGEPVDGLSRALWDSCVAAGVRPSRQFRLQSPLAIAALVAQGQAVGIVDACTASLIHRRSVDSLPLDVDFGFPVVISRSRAKPVSPDGARMIGTIQGVFDQTVARGGRVAPVGPEVPRRPGSAKT